MSTFTNSGLVTYFVESPCRTSPRNAEIDTITIHVTGGNGTSQAYCNYFSKASTQSSSNYVVDSIGTVGMAVQEKDRSWCTSSKLNDNRAVTIEVATDDPQGKNGYHVTDVAMARLIELCADICKRNNIPKMLWKGDSNLKENKTDLSKQNVTAHRWFRNKACPGDYLYGRMSYICAEVNKKLSDPTYTIPVSGGSAALVGANYGLSEQAAASSLGYLSAISAADKSVLHPYVAILPDESFPLSPDVLKVKNIHGVMIYGGALFEQNHIRRSTYHGKHTYDCAKVCEEYSYPFGLYVDVRGRNAAEAREECNALWYVISKHPPQLGLWLHIQTGLPKSITSIVIDEYYRNIERWGLLNHCGLYLTQSELQVVDWDKYCDKFALWLVQPADASFDPNILLTPQFFMLGE